jgi:predicted metalloprotease
MAHEWGHHLQNLAGLSSEQYPTPTGKELQADCLAGVWANSTYYESQLEPGDFEEAMNLAAAIGDDTLGVPEGGRAATAAPRIVRPGSSTVTTPAMAASA